MLARLETPTSVPTVSKKSTKKKASVTLQKAGCASIEKSIFMNIGESDGGMETMPRASSRRERYREHGYDDDADEDAALYAARLERDHEQQAEDGEQRGDVAAELAEAEEDGGVVDDDAGAWRPMKVMKSPMPAETPILSVLGIELTTSSRTLVQVSTMKITPSTNTAASATCHGMPMPRTTVKAKKALSPMPGASANG